MKLLELPHTLSEKISRLLLPIRATEAATVPLGPERQDQWRRVLEQLSLWRSNPGLLADEGVEAPAIDVLSASVAVAEALRDTDVEPPDGVVPNGDAGVVFLWRVAQRTWSIELESDGSIESYLVQEGKLVWRHSLHE